MTSTRFGQLFQLGYTKPASTLSTSAPVSLPGATLSFYLSGSGYTTLQPIYVDSALQTQASNPATADANGRFAPIFLNPSIQYGFQLKTAGGTLLQQADPINAQNTSLPTQLFKAAATNIVSSTVLTVDPDLTLALPLTGAYKVELDLVFTSTGGGNTPGVALSIQYSGSLNGIAGNTLAITGALNGGPLTAAQSAVAINGTVVGALSPTRGSCVLRVAGTIYVASAGTLALYWAQQTSSTIATSLEQGSSMAVTYLGLQ